MEDTELSPLAFPDTELMKRTSDRSHSMGDQPITVPVPSHTETWKTPVSGVRRHDFSVWPIGF